MTPALKAGLVYFGLVFALGVVLGTLRVFVLAPLFSETGAVLLELPVMLAASWYACRWSVERFEVSERVVSRFVMGGVAFGLLTIAELFVSLIALGRTPEEHLAAYEQRGAVLGLFGQLVFAAMPLVQWRFYARRFAEVEED